MRWENLFLTPYKNSCSGREAVIYGCGPSLQKFELDKIKADKPVHIAMKMSILCDKVPTPDWYLFGDKNPKSLLYEHLLKDLNCHKLGLIYQEGITTIKTYDKDFCKQVNAYPTHLSYRDGFQADIDKKPFYRCSTLFPCLQLALFLGCNRIFVVGVDMSEDVGFIHVPEAAKRVKNLLDKMRNHLHKFMSFKEKYYKGVKVIHVNPTKKQERFFDKELNLD